MTFPIHYGIQENITGNNWDSVVESSLVFMNNGKIMNMNGEMTNGRGRLSLTELLYVVFLLLRS